MEVRRETPWRSGEGTPGGQEKDAPGGQERDPLMQVVASIPWHAGSTGGRPPSTLSWREGPALVQKDQPAV